MTKRRVFDIDFPDDLQPETTSEGDGAGPADARRGPMASAISETADAVAARQAAQAAIRDENDALAREFVRLKKLGLIVDVIPLDQINASKLIRDRAAKHDPEMEELKASIKAIGLSNPIRVEQADEGYQLIQGYRRLQAFRELHAETGDARYSAIPAGLVARGETLDALYRRMVDENLIRRDVSFAEMADLVRNYVSDGGGGADAVQAAINTLYASAGRQKRNYIGKFVSLLNLIGPHLRFAEYLPRSVGLLLEKRLKADSGFKDRVIAALDRNRPGTALEEVNLLKDLCAARPTKEAPSASPRGQTKKTLRYQGPGGMVRCVASEGRVVVLAERDFSNIDRDQLESALDAFFRALDPWSH